MPLALLYALYVSMCSSAEVRKCVISYLLGVESIF